MNKVQETQLEYVGIELHDTVTTLTRQSLVYVLQTFCSEHFVKGGTFKLNYDENRGHHIAFSYGTFSQLAISPIDTDWGDGNGVNEFILEYYTVRPEHLTLEHINSTNIENYVCKGYFFEDLLVFQGYVNFDGGASALSIVTYIHKIMEMSKALSLHLSVCENNAA